MGMKTVASVTAAVAAAAADEHDDNVWPISDDLPGQFCNMGQPNTHQPNRQQVVEWSYLSDFGVDLLLV